MIGVGGLEIFGVLVGRKFGFVGSLVGWTVSRWWVVADGIGILGRTIVFPVVGIRL